MRAISSLGGGPPPLHQTPEGRDLPLRGEGACLNRTIDSSGIGRGFIRQIGHDVYAFHLGGTSRQSMRTHRGTAAIRFNNSLFRNLRIYLVSGVTFEDQNPIQLMWEHGLDPDKRTGSGPNLDPHLDQI